MGKSEVMAGLSHFFRFVIQVYGTVAGEGEVYKNDVLVRRHRGKYINAS